MTSFFKTRKLTYGKQQGENMNPFDILKNLNMDSMKENLEKAQAELGTMEAVGSSGGNIVKIAMNGRMEITRVQLDPICVDPRDIKMLEDLIVAAHHDAMSKIREQIKEKSGSLFGGLDVPGLGL